MKKIILFHLFISLVLINQGAISLTTFDNFEDGTSQGWVSGLPNPNPPINISSGGPMGLNDNYLQIESQGGGAGGSLVAFNTSSDWTGDWTTAGITFIRMEVNNFSIFNVTLRISIDGNGGRFSTTNGVVIPPSSGWISVIIPVSPSDFTAVDGGSNLNLTLSTVNTVRIIDNPLPAWRGQISDVVMGVDNIDATDMAFPVIFSYFKGLARDRKIELMWETTQEINNQNFNIEHSIEGEDFQIIGEVKGHGTSQKSLVYSFIHEFPNQGGNYYRIRQIDFNGSFSFSNTIFVETPQKSYAYI